MNRINKMFFVCVFTCFAGAFSTDVLVMESKRICLAKSKTVEDLSYDVIELIILFALAPEDKDDYGENFPASAFLRDLSLSCKDFRNAVDLVKNNYNLFVLKEIKIKKIEPQVLNTFLKCKLSHGFIEANKDNFNAVEIGQLIKVSWLLRKVEIKHRCLSEINEVIKSHKERVMKEVAGRYTFMKRAPIPLAKKNCESVFLLVVAAIQCGDTDTTEKMVEFAKEGILKSNSYIGSAKYLSLDILSDGVHDLHKICGSSFDSLKCMVYDLWQSVRSSLRYKVTQIYFDKVLMSFFNFVIQDDDKDVKELYRLFLWIKRRSFYFDMASNKVLRKVMALIEKNYEKDFYLKIRKLVFPWGDR